MRPCARSVKFTGFTVAAVLGLIYAKFFLESLPHSSLEPSTTGPPNAEKVQRAPIATVLPHYDGECLDPSLSSVQDCTRRLLASCRRLSGCGEDSVEAQPHAAAEENNLFSVARSLARKVNSTVVLERCGDVTLTPLTRASGHVNMSVEFPDIFCVGHFCSSEQVKIARSTCTFHALSFNSRVTGFEEALPSLMIHVLVNTSRVCYVAFLSYNDFNGNDALDVWLSAMRAANITTVVQRRRYVAPDSWARHRFGKQGLLAEGWINLFAAALFNRKNSVRMLAWFEDKMVIKFEWILFLRPDMVFASKFDWLSAAEGVNFVVPPAPPPQRNDHGGLNDQIALCRGRSSAEFYSSVCDQVDKYCSTGVPMHPESLFARHFLNVTISRSRVQYALSGSRRRRACANKTYTLVKIAFVSDVAGRVPIIAMERYLKQWLFGTCSACLSSSFRLSWRRFTEGDDLAQYSPHLVVLLVAGGNVDELPSRSAHAVSRIVNATKPGNHPPYFVMCSPLPEFSLNDLSLQSLKRRRHHHSARVTVTNVSDTARGRALASLKWKEQVPDRTIFLDLHFKVLRLLLADTSRRLQSTQALLRRVPLDSAAGQESVRKFFGSAGYDHLDRTSSKMIAVFLLDVLFSSLQSKLLEA